MIVSNRGQSTNREPDLETGNNVAPSSIENNTTCYISINETSCEYLQHAISLYKPNFAILQLRFRYMHHRYSRSVSKNADSYSIKPYLLEPSTSFTEDAIRPYEWVWTYYSPDSFFPYLKWPTDFSIVSFNLLSAKTLKIEMFLVVEVPDMHCLITIGQPNTTRALSYALRDLTRDYLVRPDTGDHRFDYTYWCHLSVVPGIKETTSYQFGIYLGYPVEFIRYNCCRTEVPRSGNKSLQIRCPTTQISQMWQGTFLPYVLGVLATAFCPLVFFYTCAKIKIDKFTLRKKSLHILVSDEDDDEDDFDFCPEVSGDWVYLDGRPPLSFTHIIGGFCGLGNKYPIIVSRIWRFIAYLCGPIIVFMQLYLYWKYQHNTTLDMIDHGLPLGYLSMLAGFEKSRNNFMPILGGPFCLLIGYYIVGLIFMVGPKHLDRILQSGCNKYLFTEELSPLLYSMATIEYYANVNFTEISCGYRLSYLLMKTMFYTTFNPTFWFHIWIKQIQRFKKILHFSTIVCFKIAVFIMVLPVYVIVCTLECTLTFIYYGIPFINVLFIIFTGYFIWVSGFLRKSRRQIEQTLYRIMKYFLMMLIACLFLYFIISVFTILSLSFAFLGRIVVFCFISVIVYPSTSFGYLFFGIVIVYYIFKMISGLGNGYLELLADAIDVSSQMENGMHSNQVIDNVLIIDDLIPSDITKIQIRNRIVNLSSVQRQTVYVAAREEKQPKLMQKNNFYGIPRDLFQIIVKKHRPVYIQVTHAILKLIFIVMLIGVTISVVVLHSSGPGEELSEMMHVVFIIAVGALPRVLEVAMDGVSHNVKKEIHLRELRTTINQYWCSQYSKVNFP